MKSSPIITILSVVLLILSGCDSQAPEQADEPTPSLSFQERFRAAQARERPLLDSGVTAKMWQGTKNIIDEFFPEAAAKIAREQNIPLEEAEAQLRERMKTAADRAREEYVKEGGYGTIVTILSVAEELDVIRKVLEGD